MLCVALHLSAVDRVFDRTVERIYVWCVRVWKSNTVWRHEYKRQCMFVHVAMRTWVACVCECVCGRFAATLCMVHTSTDVVEHSTNAFVRFVFIIFLPFIEFWFVIRTVAGRLHWFSIHYRCDYTTRGHRNIAQRSSWTWAAHTGFDGKRLSLLYHTSRMDGLFGWAHSNAMPRIFSQWFYSVQVESWSRFEEW